MNYPTAGYQHKLVGHGGLTPPVSHIGSAAWPRLQHSQSTKPNLMTIIVKSDINGNDRDTDYSDTMIVC